MRTAQARSHDNALAPNVRRPLIARNQGSPTRFPGNLDQPESGSFCFPQRLPGRPPHRAPRAIAPQAAEQAPAPSAIARAVPRVFTAGSVRSVAASTASIGVNVLRVFTDEAGAFGNLLGIVDGALVPPDQRQRAAAQVGYCETVFIDDPVIGRMQIFTPAVQLPFAGHPTIGTAWWLRQQGYDAERLLTPAGPVEVARDETLTWIRARADWTPQFAWHEIAGPDAVEAADPSSYSSGQHYLWAWVDETAGRVRSRMFAPEMGIVEDEATGAAAIGFTALQKRDLDITQGRGSRIYTRWDGGSWASIGGRVTSGPLRTIPAELHR
jgi:predicted PhzF superfamily epimerase YddE/YHI9